METPSRRNNVENVTQPNTLLETPPSGIEITPQDIIGNTNDEKDSKPNKRRGLKLIAGIAAIAAAGGATAFALTSSNNSTGNPQEGTKPSPVETSAPSPEETPQTLSEYIDTLKAFTGPQELVLPESASADEFGKWTVDIYNKATLASCDKIDEIGEAAVDLALSDTPVEGDELYTELAKANINDIMEASYGTSWPNNQRSVNMRDMFVKNNVSGIKNCITNTPDQLLTRSFISAKDLGINTDNQHVFDVRYTVTTNNPDTSANGEWDETYITDSENGNVIIVDSVANKQ